MEKSNKRFKNESKRKSGKNPSVNNRQFDPLKGEWIELKIMGADAGFRLNETASKFVRTQCMDDVVLTIFRLLNTLGSKENADILSYEKFLERLINMATKNPPLTLNGYQRLATKTCLATSDNNAYCLLGLAEETGEVMGKVAKGIRKGFVRFDEDNNLVMPVNDETKAWKELLKKELGDVMWMVSQVARTFGWNLEEICKDNLEKLADRKERSVIDSEGDNR